MKSIQKTSRWLLVSGLLILLMTGCTKDSEEEDTSVYNPECSVQELIQAIDDANADGVPSEIQLPANCIYTLTQVENSFPWNNMIINNGLPAIISEITIRGNNSTIQIQLVPGSDPFGHFYLDVESKLMLYDLTLSGGARNAGGSILSNHGDLFVYNVDFLNNRAIQPTNDSVANGGAIYSYFSKVRILANSLFQGNLAGVPVPVGDNLGGAVYAINSSLLINDSTFIENYVAGHGGAVYAEKTAGFAGGGLILIQDGTFQENQAVLDGGALAFMNEREGVFIASSHFYTNQANGRGGAIFSQDSDVTTNFSQFHYNQAENGGAVYTRRTAEGEFSVFVADNSVYTYNTAEESAGAFFSENSDVEAFNTIFVYNEADRCGGLQLGGYPDLDVPAGELQSAPRINSRSEFKTGSASSNRAFYGDGGGACHLMGELILDDWGFDDNQAASYGGGLLTMDVLEATDTVFSGNQAYRGGGLAVGFPVDDNNPLSPSWLNFYSHLIGVQINENVAEDQGGGIWAHSGGALDIDYSSIGGNTADQEGGGMYLDEGNVYLENSTLAENTASRGGGLYNVGDNFDLHLIHTTVAYNTATDVGIGPRPGGGGINTKNLSIIMRQVLVVENTNEDCTFGPIAVTGGTRNIFDDKYHLKITYGIDSDGTCELLDTENIPQIGGFNGSYVPIQAGSPLIDRSAGGTCYRTIDQIGTSRPQGSYCEPGSIEYQAIAPPPPAPPAPAPEAEEQNCDPFAGMEVSVHMLNVNPDSLVLPVYLRFDQDVPEIGADGSVPFEAHLGGVQAHLANQQGFSDRVYFMFELKPDMPGTLQSFSVVREGCDEDNPAFVEPRLTIPELPTGELTCNQDLGQKDCEKAGGVWFTGVDNPYCLCP